MPRHTEPSVNDAMGLLLQTMLSRSSVRSENTRTIAGHPSLHPDILITGLGRSPVVIEAEYMPTADVEPDAKKRLSLELEADSRPIEAVIALRYPDDIGDAGPTSAQNHALNGGAYVKAQVDKEVSPVIVALYVVGYNTNDLAR